jgi:SPX domain protein involved in polyphosphate accumulation
VGIIPELIEHQQNGYIVEERTPDAFWQAFLWCEQNLSFIRETSQERAQKCREIRNWNVCAQYWKRVYLDAITYAKEHPSPPDFQYPPVYIPKTKKQNRWDRRLERWIRPYLHALFGKNKN